MRHDAAFVAKAVQFLGACDNAATSIGTGSPLANPFLNPTSLTAKPVRLFLFVGTETRQCPDLVAEQSESTGDGGEFTCERFAA